MAPAPPATLLEKIDTYRILGQTLLVAITQFLTTPIRSGPRPTSLFKDSMYRALRFQLTALNLSQEKYLWPSTESTYLATAKEDAFQPESLTLKSGCKAFWFGSSKADKVIIFFHASPAHTKWISGLSRDLSKSFSVSVLMLAYTCAPEAQYPTQLSQAAELLNHLLTVEGRKPSDIFFVGDSAGGNLELALFSHSLHPHSSVPTKIELSEPLGGAVLISPWINFDVNQTSFDRNVQTDMITQEVGVRWAGAFSGSAKPDNYLQPILADSKWFSGLEGVVGDVLVWGGGGEVLIDSIEEMANKLKEALPSTKFIVEPGACHEDFIIEKHLGYTKKAQGTDLIEQWISSKL